MAAEGWLKACMHLKLLLLILHRLSRIINRKNQAGAYSSFVTGFMVTIIFIFRGLNMASTVKEGTGITRMYGLETKDISWSIHYKLNTGYLFLPVFKNMSKGSFPEGYILLMISFCGYTKNHTFFQAARHRQGLGSLLYWSG